MTRLRTEWIASITTSMDAYNRQLREKIGLDLTGLTQEAWQLTDEEISHARKTYKAAVIPVTQGEGIIGSFSESVAAIVASMSFQADVMEQTDVDGVYAAMTTGHQILFFADDTRYLAVNVTNGVCADNNYATALGFICGLRALMAKAGRTWGEEKVLQIGYGIVGKEAAKILASEGVDFAVYDQDPKALAAFHGEKAESAASIKEYHNILDLTNTGGWLTEAALAEDVLYASPGVPYSMDEAAAARFEACSLHDQLEIGTAIMLGQCIRQ